jgi:ketosteroid isomerase-like protein
MSAEAPPRETIQAGFDAFNRGDYEAWLDIYDEDTYIVMRYRDQKVVWTQTLIDRADALEAAGLKD